MNVVFRRVYNFLKNYPPFDLLSEAEMILISKHTKVIYIEKNETLFTKGDVAHEYFYILHEGVIVLKREEEDNSPSADVAVLDTTIDICDRGELFGLRPLIAQDEYLMTAIAEEESIIYGIPIDMFRPILQSNQRVGLYVIEAFASKTKNPYYSEYLDHLYKDKQVIRQHAIDDLQIVKSNKHRLTCNPEESIKQVAQSMATHKSNIAVITTPNRKPIGIVSDKDLRVKVATGEYPINACISEIMSTPIITFSDNMSIAQAQLNMLKHDISHLCITEDGTDQTPLKGIISERDVVVHQANNAPSLVRSIRRCQKPKQLKKVRMRIERLLRNYISNNIPMGLIFKIFHEINEAMTRRAIELALKKMSEPPPCKFSWLSLGSHGRAEQFLLTDQDNAIVFEDVVASDYKETKEYFLKFARRVNKTLKSIGYEYCPADMMAQNPNWCLSVDQWKNNFKRWIHDYDDILMCSIFFDFSCSYGDVLLGDQLREYIIKHTKDRPIFFSKLGKNALAKPSPLGFFKQFLVEQNGEHKNSFDLKARALMPMIDIGRVLILSHGIMSISNTTERFERLAEIEPQNKKLFLSCSYAIKALLKFRTKHGLIHNDSGRYIHLDELTKEERIKLKRSFKVLASIQELIKIRFRVLA